MAVCQALLSFVVSLSRVVFVLDSFIPSSKKRARDTDREFGLTLAARLQYGTIRWLLHKANPALEGKQYARAHLGPAVSFCNMTPVQAGIAFMWHALARASLSFKMKAPSSRARTDPMAKRSHEHFSYFITY